MQPTDWGDIIDIDWEACFRAWNQVSAEVTGDIEFRTGEYLSEVVTNIIAVGLDDERSLQDFSGVLGIALAEVSLDALIETMFYAVQIIEANLDRAGVADVVHLGELAQIADDPVDPTLLKALEGRHSPAYARLLGGWYQAFTEGLTMITTLLMADLHLLVLQAEEVALKQGQSQEEYGSGLVKAIETIVEEAVVNYLGSNRHLAMSLLTPEEQERMGGDNPGFFVHATLDKSEVRIRLSHMSPLGKA